MSGRNIVNTCLICPPIHFTILYGLPTATLISGEGWHHDSVLRAQRHHRVYPMANDV